jgi:hypothetical protein
MMDLPKPLLIYFLAKENRTSKIKEPAPSASTNSDITAAIEDALIQYKLALQNKGAISKQFIRAGNNRLNWLLKHQPTS